MGWSHATLTILAVVGAPFVLSSLLTYCTYQDPLGCAVYFAPFAGASLLTYWPDAGWTRFYEISDVLQMILLWAPAPVVVGITLWRKRASGERPRADGRTTLPAMTTVAILGLWWLLLIGNPIRHLIGW